MASEERGRDPVAAALQERAERLRREAMVEFGDAPVLNPVPVTPPPWHDDHEHPDSVADQLDQMPGIASCILVDDDCTVLVQKGWAGGWDDPGGALEPGESLADTAERETEEETNLDVELVDLLYTRDLMFQAFPTPAERFIRLCALRFSNALPLRRPGDRHRCGRRGAGCGLP